MTVQPLTLTDAAANRVTDLISQNGPANLGLRIGVKTAGCSSLTYVLEFVTEQKPGEDVYEDKGIKLFITPQDMLFLTGLVMDVREGKSGSSFVFNNPNEEKGCGCGGHG